jgi:hypothetical protein
MDAEIGIENLMLARDVLTTLNVRYFLMDGTLLGLVRNGRFIDSDNEDIDIGILAEDFNFVSFGRCTSLMRQKGFSVHFVDGRWGKDFIYQWRRKGIQLDLYFYFRRGDQRILHVYDSSDMIVYSYPAWMVENTSPVEFYGRTFMAPKYREAVLEHQYGDWKIRKKDWDWTTSPLNITFRMRRTKLKMLQTRLSNKILRKIWRVMDIFWRPSN